MTVLDATAYLAAEGHEADLLAELGEVMGVYGRVVLAAGPPRPAAWAQNLWLEPMAIDIASIGEGAKALRALQRNWAPYAFHLHRRTQLIQDRLPSVSAKPLSFPSPPPKAPLGSWTLLDANRILAAARCSSPFPNGEIRFQEDKTFPPNRAYLKLWEAFTILGMAPLPGEFCLDLGSSPGGWTAVLQQLGANILSVDKAPLAPAIAVLPRVEFRRQSAFALQPREVGPVDWLFCDVICYPERLLKLVKSWIDSSLCPRFVCTLKFQGETDHSICREFSAIPQSRLMHLFHNKHELTWVKSDAGWQAKP